MKRDNLTNWYLSDMQNDEHNVAHAENGSHSENRLSPIPVIPELSVALGLLIFVFGVTYIGASGVFTKDTEDMRVETKPQAIEQIASPGSAFNDVKLEAKSAIVWDVKSQRVLFNKNADEQLPLASITKLMTALVAYELLDPDEMVTVTLNAIAAEGDNGFTDGEEFTMQNLSDLTLISSSNDGAIALSTAAGSAAYQGEDPEVVFVRAMNLKAEELGLTKTYFRNSTGLDMSPTAAGAYGSARDIAHLMEYIVTHIKDAVALTKLDITTINNERGEYHIAKNTNEAVSSIDGLIASKTGYTELSGGNLVVAVNMGLNRTVIIAVLGSSQEGRFSDTLELLTRTRRYIESEG